MFVDWCYQSLFRGGDYVVYFIGSGGWAGVVVESPCHTYRTFEMAGKVYNIIVFESPYLLRCRVITVLAE